MVQGLDKVVDKWNELDDTTKTRVGTISLALGGIGLGSAAVINPRVGGSHGDMAQALAMAVYSQRGSAGTSRRAGGGGYDEGFVLRNR